MKLGTLKDSKFLDGVPVVVSHDNKNAVPVDDIIPSLLMAIENWQSVEPQLRDVYNQLNGNKFENTIVVDEAKFHSPLPRTYHWVDGSAFIHHVKLVRKARNAPLPEDLETSPLVYQGGSDDFLGPRDNIPMVDFNHGMDFEAEICVITDFVPMGTKAKDALAHIKLLMICNDVSLRGLIPNELKKGFGFYQSKPATAFAPFAVSTDELGDAWKDGKLSLPLNSEYNGKWFGNPNGSEMFFDFGQLIEHLTLTRNLSAGTIIGSGTVSNEDPAAGSSCLAEKRMLEKIKDGEFKTPFMKNGDTIKIWMNDNNGKNLFGTIEQKIEQKK